MKKLLLTLTLLLSLAFINETEAITIQDCPTAEEACLPPEDRPGDCIPQDEQIIVTWVGIIPIITIVPAITC